VPKAQMSQHVIRTPKKSPRPQRVKFKRIWLAVSSGWAGGSSFNSSWEYQCFEDDEYVAKCLNYVWWSWGGEWV